MATLDSDDHHRARQGAHKWAWSGGVWWGEICCHVAVVSLAWKPRILEDARILEEVDGAPACHIGQKPWRNFTCAWQGCLQLGVPKTLLPTNLQPTLWKEQVEGLTVAHSGCFCTQEPNLVQDIANNLFTSESCKWHSGLFTCVQNGAELQGLCSYSRWGCASNAMRTCWRWYQHTHRSMVLGALGTQCWVRGILDWSENASCATRSKEAREEVGHTKPQGQGEKRTETTSWSSATCTEVAQHHQAVAEARVWSTFYDNTPE